MREMFRYSIMKTLRSVSNDMSKRDKREKNSSSPATGTEENTSLANNDSHHQQQHMVAVPDDVILMKRGYLLMEGNGILGEGTYSKVKRAYSKFQKCDVAVKILNRKIAPRDFLKRFLPRELQIIGHVNHPNIVNFYEVIDTGDRAFIVMQYVPNGDLLEFIQKTKFIKEVPAKMMFTQVERVLRNHL